MPKSCKECPLTYLDTGDDAYFGVNEKRCIIDDSCVDGMVSERPCDCPLIEAISKAEYEARLKADIEAILDKIRAEIEKQEKWLLQAGYNAYNVDIAFNSVKSVLAENEVEE